MFIEVTIPTVEQKKEILYDTRSYPVPQKIYDYPSSGIVIPENNYLIKHNETYYHPTIAELTQCKRNRDYVICPSEQFNFTSAQTCEQLIFVNDTRANYENCDILYTNEFHPTIMIDRKNQRAFYTIFEEIIAILKCINNTNYLRLKEAGIVSWREECELLIDETYSFVRTKPMTYGEIVIPTGKLEVQLLTTVLNDTHTNDIFKEITRFGVKKPIKKWEKIVCEQREREYIYISSFLR